ncbi:hypothetical protein H2248_004773 [Termitomyces sp. 'cryptogamus']|nr:hypothetical protein H2248_004773 [Termitomyces sp. 'cryptogamus']
MYNLDGHHHNLACHHSSSSSASQMVAVIPKLRHSTSFTSADIITFSSYIHHPLLVNITPFLYIPTSYCLIFHSIIVLHYIKPRTPSIFFHSVPLLYCRKLLYQETKSMYWSLEHIQMTVSSDHQKI